MSTVIVPIQGVAPVLSDTDDPIVLVDWISSFIETLEKLNGVVDKIATVRITLCLANPSILIQCLDSSLRTSSVGYPLVRFQCLAVALYRLHNIIYGWQIIIEQVHLDVSICALLSKMNEVYTFPTTAGLNDIKSMKAIVGRITHQTVECLHFIRGYSANQKFGTLTWS